jgi:hypothetical protein
MMILIMVIMIIILIIAIKHIMPIMTNMYDYDNIYVIAIMLIIACSVS